MNGAAIISATIRIKTRRMYHFLVGAPATGSQLAFDWSLRANRLPGPKDFFRIVTSEALLASSPFTQSGGWEYQEIASAVASLTACQNRDTRCQKFFGVTPMFLEKG
jgi:hypothetical protein